MTARVDNRLSDCPMVSVDCRRCGARVLARKSSWDQTSVQWDAQASALCLERRDAQHLAAHSGRGVFLACSALSGSIADAVRHGDLPVVDEIVQIADTRRSV
ncbi:ferredoxin [Mycobacterium kyorinense]|uniref:Ferredoxin n=1 Tax=Mycobacterium kyorinense TaxID=487514 RepID=A0A1A2ZWE3_9MYCO|nr:ferredoxin [Mycobacterium kyorinense]OBI53396.1 ferredoxin [Mycobacterium kyorinense]